MLIGCCYSMTYVLDVHEIISWSFDVSAIKVHKECNNSQHDQYHWQQHVRSPDTWIKNSSTYCSLEAYRPVWRAVFMLMTLRMPIVRSFSGPYRIHLVALGIPVQHEYWV